jgi:hypothetical protein
LVELIVAKRSSTIAVGSLTTKAETSEALGEMNSSAPIGPGSAQPGE